MIILAKLFSAFFNKLIGSLSYNELESLLIGMRI